MTADTVQHYFLRAGASYRTSDVWRKLHETESGKSRVLRSGRFGIGVLAAFLLGDEIEVTTRHIDCREDEAVYFRATLDDDVIELERHIGPVGTSVSVKLRPECATALTKLVRPSTTFGSLPDQLYLLQSPSLDVYLPGKCDLEHRWPSQGDALPPGWHRIIPPGFGEVHWTYEIQRGSSRYEAVLACNGIAVGSLSTSWESDAGKDIQPPSISVFDPDGHLPLVLTRTKLATERLPFQAELVADICRDIVAYCLADPRPGEWRERSQRFGPERLPVCAHPALKAPHYQDYYLTPLPYVFTPEGFALQDEWIMRQLAVKSLVVFGRLST